MSTGHDALVATLVEQLRAGLLTDARATTAEIAKTIEALLDVQHEHARQEYARKVHEFLYEALTETYAPGLKQYQTIFPQGLARLTSHRHEPLRHFYYLDLLARDGGGSIRITVEWMKTHLEAI